MTLALFDLEPPKRRPGEWPLWLLKAHRLDWAATGRGLAQCACGELLGEVPSIGPARINAAGALRRAHWSAIEVHNG